MKMAESDKLGLNDDNDYVGECFRNRAAAAADDNCNPSSIPIPNANTGTDPHFASFNDHSSNIQRASDLLVALSSRAEAHKARILDLAHSASEEVRLMAQEQESLWLFDVDNGYEVLNQAEYKQRFALLDPTLEEIIRVIKQGEYSDLYGYVQCQSDGGCLSSSSSCTTRSMNSEGSRANGVVFRNPISLVNMFMDVHKWSATFANIVSKAMNLAVLGATGNKENPNGCLQVMIAEFHISSPLVKPRQMYFVRHSRQVDVATWVVADVSLESIFPSPVLTPQRKPSGCVIQALQDGVSMVTWVEHTAEYEGAVQSMFKGLLESGVAFNAKRWISTLERQCDRIATLQAHEGSLNNGGPGAARNGLLKLAEKMFRHFNSNICSNSSSAWRVVNLPGADDILIKSSFNLDDQQIPSGVTVSIATSIWLPVRQNQVFNFLRDEHNRTKWDILSHGLGIQEVVRVSSARHSTDYVSVVSVEASSTRTAITYLQESFSDSLAHYIVYAPVDVPTMQHILQGGSVESVAIMPSGLVVLPESENSILTVAFQIMDEQLTTPEWMMPPCSELTAYTLIKQTISLIRTALNVRKREE